MEIIKIIEKEKKDFNPDVIFTHHNGDLNIDHKKTFEAVYTAVRPTENGAVKTLICFETMSGTGGPRVSLKNLVLIFLLNYLKMRFIIRQKQ